MLFKHVKGLRKKKAQILLGKHLKPVWGSKLSFKVSWVSFFCSFFFKYNLNLKGKECFSSVRRRPQHFLTVHLTGGHCSTSRWHMFTLRAFLSVLSKPQFSFLIKSAVGWRRRCPHLRSSFRQEDSPSCQLACDPGSAALRSLKAWRSSWVESKAAVCRINSLRHGKTNRRLTCFS